VTAKPLQRRTARPFKRYVAAWPVTAIAEKIFLVEWMVMTLARLLLDGFVESATAAGSVRSVAGVSAAPSPIADIAGGSSIATIAGLAAGTLRCNSASWDALAETRVRIPLANTSGFVAAGRSLYSFLSFSGSLDFVEDLKDLDWGSWEGLLPESSSLGEDASPLRGAFPFSIPSSARLFPKLYQASLILMTGFLSSKTHAVPQSFLVAPFRRHPAMATWLSLACQNGLLFRRHRHVGTVND
jgi:hypothetical protein